MIVNSFVLGVIATLAAEFVVAFLAVLIIAVHKTIKGENE